MLVLCNWIVSLPCLL